MPRPHQPRHVRPHIIVWEGDYWRSTSRARCTECGVDYRVQSVSAYARWLRNHRHCGLTPGWCFERGWRSA